VAQTPSMRYVLCSIYHASIAKRLMASDVRLIASRDEPRFKKLLWQIQY
jgi:hypothetical protein